MIKECHQLIQKVAEKAAEELFTEVHQDMVMAVLDDSIGEQDRKELERIKFGSFYDLMSFFNEVVIKGRGK